MGARRITHVCSPEKHCDECDADHVLCQLSYMFKLMRQGMHVAYNTHALVFFRSENCGCGGCR